MSNLVINETPGFDLEDMVQLFERHIAHGTFAFLRRGSISFRDEEEYEEEGEGNEADEGSEKLGLKVSPCFIVWILVTRTRFALIRNGRDR